MDNLEPVDSPTLRLHKRQVIWQILVPFVLAALTLLASGVWLVLGETAQTRVWADVSIIWLLVPMLLLSLAALAMFVLLIIGMAKLLQLMPRFTSRAQQIAGQVAGGTRKVADGVVKPTIWIEQAGFVIKSIFTRKR